MEVFIKNVHVQSLSVPQLFATLWTLAHQAPLSMTRPRQEYWNRLLFPSPGVLPDPGMEPASPEAPALAGGFFTSEPPEKFAKNNIVSDDFHSDKIVTVIKLQYGST